MEKLLKLATETVSEAEIYHLEESTDSVEFNDGKLEKADTSLSSGIALRVLKNGRVGLAHTRNLLDPQDLIKQALSSAANGMDAAFRFPHTENVRQVDTYSPTIETLDKKGLVLEGTRLIDYVKKRSQAQVNVNFQYTIESSGIMNSAGTNLSQKSSGFMVLVNLVFPGTGTGLYRYHLGRDRQVFPEEELDELIELYRISENQIVPQTGVLPVIFTPQTLSALLWRFAAASSPVSFYNKVSPLLNRKGEQIFSPKIDIWQDPHDPQLSSSTGFDGEGMPTRKLAFVEKGVFKAIPTDLNYAQKLGLEPTGNGFRASVESQPAPQGICLHMGTGDKTLKDMIASLDRGIIVYSLMGAHSGNILNGDYSVGISSGFYVENGVLKGRVKDCLLSGNIYNTFNQVAAIESRCQNLGNYKFPSILFDGISVSGK